MTGHVIQMLPEGRYASKDLERLANELIQHVQFPDVMHTKDAARFLGVSPAQLYRTPNIPSHKVAGIGRVYVKSELIDYIKKH